MVNCPTRCETRWCLVIFLYLVYINDLIVKIEQSSLHTCILNIPSNCPSLADDFFCIGLTPLSLQNMLNIALAYSRKWRFKFNTQKSCILKFRAKGNRANQDYDWTLGEDVVPCLDVGNHLGSYVRKSKVRVPPLKTCGRNPVCEGTLVINENTEMVTNVTISWFSNRPENT